MLIDYKRVLCPVQFDKNSLAALAVAKEIATQNKGKLFVMHVVSAHTDPTRVGGAAMAAHDEKVAQEELAKLEKEQLADIDHEVVRRLGNPAEEVGKAEHEFGIDLVVMANARPHRSEPSGARQRRRTGRARSGLPGPDHPRQVGRGRLRAGSRISKVRLWKRSSVFPSSHSVRVEDNPTLSLSHI